MTTDTELDEQIKFLRGKAAHARDLLDLLRDGSIARPAVKRSVRMYDEVIHSLENYRRMLERAS